MNRNAREFLLSAAKKSADLSHRDLLKRSIGSYQNSVAAGRSRFIDWEAARRHCQEIKWEAVNHLDKYLLEFERRVIERGGHVFWAETAEEARAYILNLAAGRSVRTIVKSKSMVAEEIHLTPALEKQGLRVFETDLGEFIVQLRGEAPYHIVTPAMHLDRSQIAAVFKDKLGAVGADDPELLVAAARQALRQAFFEAEMGVTGANFLVADAGMVAITTNEGNADLGISLPRIHVAISGIEKVIPRLQDLDILLPVLATSGTGQHITCYNTLVGGPRQSNEIGGPDEFHVVLLDNGRSELLADAEKREVLHCIRCGACLNACPVYRVVGGHTYATTYQGPIGSVLTPQLRGLNEFQHLSFASSLCGACAEACPVRIDLHHHLLQNRRDAVNQADRPWSERLAFKLWRAAMSSPAAFRWLAGLGRYFLRAAYALGLARTPLDPLRPWTSRRAAPHIPRRSFRAAWKDIHAAK